MDIKQKQLMRRLGYGSALLATFVVAGYFVSKYAIDNDKAVAPEAEAVSLKVIPSKDDIKRIEDDGAKKRAEDEKIVADKVAAMAKKAEAEAAAVAAASGADEPKELNVSNIEFKPITPNSYFIRASINNPLPDATDWPELQVTVTYGSQVIDKKVISKEAYLAGLRLQGVNVPSQIKGNDKFTVSANVHFDELSVKPDGFKVKVFAPE